MIDTIEAIIIALVIALTFRAFIVEAFVIPTGSMAPTLLGAHFKVICPECGYEFDYNASLLRQAQGPDQNHLVLPNGDDQHAELVNNQRVPLGEVPIYCPNCRYPISPAQLPQYLFTASPDIAGGGGQTTRSFAWANNGDRILVLKYLYALQDPHRWDVIVFKEPKDARDNYIKRLIGKPGETVEIIGGDVYITPADVPAAQRDDPTKRVIARKPEAIQPYLWQLVYDNDFYPKDEGLPRPRPMKEFQDNRPLPPATPAFENPWESKDAWAKGPVMTYPEKPGLASGPSVLAFNLSAPQTAGVPYTLNNLGYNNDYYVGGGQFTPRSYVGDLRLEALWTPQSGDGLSLTLTLGRPGNCYRVEWTGGGLVLERFDVNTGQFAKVAGATINPVDPPRGGTAYAVALNNVDHAVQFYLNGKKVISYEQPWNAADAKAEEAAHPDDDSTRPDTMIQIGVNGPCTLAHLKLFRDLYYTQVLPGFISIKPTGTEGNPVTLGQGEYFALGDNSRQSADSRLWETVYPALADLGSPETSLRPGIVPERYLLGKAFFVYWPAGYRPAPGVPYPIIPDAGDMRVIR